MNLTNRTKMTEFRSTHDTLFSLERAKNGHLTLVLRLELFTVRFNTVTGKVKTVRMNGDEVTVQSLEEMATKLGGLCLQDTGFLFLTPSGPLQLRTFQRENKLYRVEVHFAAHSEASLILNALPGGVEAFTAEKSGFFGHDGRFVLYPQQGCLEV